MTVIIATSYLDEAERCHRVAMVNQGRILLEGDPVELQSRNGKSDLSEIFVDVLSKEIGKEDLKANLERLGDHSVHLNLQKDEAVVRVDGLTKKFGNFVAVDHVSFDIYPGEIFGFLGPNGAGKTTVIKMLCGILNPTGGDAFISGCHIKHQR